MADEPFDDRQKAPERSLVLNLLAASGLVGAGGVSLAAMAAHQVNSPSLATAATMMMIHAGAAVGLLALATALHTRMWAWIAAVMLLGVTLFAAPIASTAKGMDWVPGYFAPMGGSLLIASWVLVTMIAAASVLRMR